MNFSLWGFWGSLLAYSIVSVGLFIVTSSGWGAALMIFPTGIFYGGLLVLTLLASLVARSQGTTAVTLSRRALGVLLTLQLGALLFNFGDCGDNPGGGAFIFRMLLPEDTICQSQTIYASSLLTTVSLGLYTALALVTLWISGSTYWKARPMGNRRASIVLASMYSIVVALLFAGALWTTWQYVGADYRRDLSYLEIDATGKSANCRTRSSQFKSTAEFCEFLFHKYGYTFRRESTGRYTILGRDFGLSDFVSILMKKDRTI